ncbi:hypothetical protein K501DRAFT_320858 [Backusella circina FSU 941]|nr:hypothetical protein K501DRAFT_320858 [Backusella circina FSU 941]
MLKQISSVSLLFGFLLSFLFIRLSDAAALTYNVQASEKPCFFTWADKPGKKIGFYFAVQQGGSFDIDYAVTGPDGVSILSGEHERQGDYVFTANNVGEYAFCFSNDMSTWSDKLIDFEILLENEARAQFQNAEQPVETLTQMEEIMFRLSGSLANIQRTQRYFRSRENRNSATVISTKSRISWFAWLESVAIISMATLQVFVIKSFFKSKKGGV